VDTGSSERSTGRRGPARPGRFQGAIRPYTRATGYYAKSWRRYLSGSSPDDLPTVRPTVALAGHAFRDEIVLAGFRVLRPSRAPDLVERAEREVHEAVDVYASAGWFDHPGSFLPAPPRLESVSSRAVVSARRRYWTLSFPSEYEPHHGEPGRDRWLGYEANRQVHAWLLRHDEPRPWVIAVHGTAMGRPRMDMAIFRARELHERYGLNVVMPVLPLHGPRSRSIPKGAGFPSEDVVDNVHGTAQAVWDLRRMISWIRAEEGSDAMIGISSVSLGGYVSALVASLEEDLACVILGVPVVDLVDLVDRHAGPAPSEEQWRSVELARRVATVVSPLALTPRVRFEGRFIYAGLADRLVHPRYQVARLWEHWGRPQITWYPGGHAGFFRSRPVQDFIERALAQSGMVVARPRA
jgi:hypothetical protein